MPTDDVHSLLKGGISPLYYFHGENTRALDDALALLHKHLFGDTDADFDSDRFDAHAHAPADVMMAARTMPLCVERRLVVASRVDAWGDEGLAPFKSYCEKPSSSACLVFISTVERKKLSGWVKKNGCVCAFTNPRWDKDIRAFVVQELARYNKKAHPAALKLLCEEFNGNAQTMSGELEKLALYCRDRQTIDEADVAQALSAGHHNTIFTLVESIGSERVGKTLGYLHQLLDDGLAPLQVLAMIARQFRMLARVCEAGPRQSGAARIRQMLGLRSDFLAEKVIKQAAGWSSACFGSVFDELSSADRQLKSSRKDARIILESLLLRLDGLRRQPSV
jgi:DNA polymerase III subunit delta